MPIEMPEAVQEALIRTGMVARAEVQTRTVTVPSPTSAPYKAPTASAPGFLPPEWYNRLRFAMLGPSQRGACLFGPRGSGKTTSVHHLSKAESVQLITYQAAEGCTIDDLVGIRDLRDGKTVFTPGPLPEALLSDCWLLIEEANMMRPGVFSKLNTLTDGSGDTLRLPDGSKLSVGARFRVVLAFNEGSSYSGAKEVNAALRDRLMPIYADYLPEKTEVSMLVAKTGCDEPTARKLVGLAKQVRAASDSTGFDLSPRAMFRMLELIRDCGDTWAKAFEHAVLDLIGDPKAKKLERQAVSMIADANGLKAWTLPRFTPIAPMPVASVPSDATTPTNGGAR